MGALDEHGLAENTLVIFTSDQGLAGGHHGMWGMGDHSRPIHTFEETIHIPLIFRDPQKIAADSICEHRTCNYDFMPTLLDYLGLADHIPEASPGQSYVPALLGESQDWDNTIFHEFEDVRMVRNDQWKYTWRFPNGLDELYDMVNDPGERNNLVGKAEYKDTVTDLRGEIEAFFDEYADPQYDLWKDGRSKAGRLINKDK